jgi:hypothetical protein
MKNFTEEFDCLLEFIGWGDPNGGLWTIGIEEAGEWCIDRMTEEARKEFIKMCGESPDGRYDLNYVKKCIKEKFCKPYIFVKKGENLSWPIANISAKIGCGVSQSFKDWKEEWKQYRENLLWQEGSKIFNGNLYPLGKKSLEKRFNECGCYEELFGISEDSLSKYYKIVKECRFPKIREFKEKCKPQAIICYGKSFWDEFKEAFDLKEEGKKIENGKIEIYPEEKVILTPHFSRYSLMPDDMCNKVINILKEWKVSLP